MKKAVSSKSRRPGSRKPGASENTFDIFFEQSRDPIWLLEPRSGTLVDGNEAAVTLLRAGSRKRLVGSQLQNLAPEFQLDGAATLSQLTRYLQEVEKTGTAKFDWLGRRFDGSLVPLEITATRLSVGGRNLQAM